MKRTEKRTVRIADPENQNEDRAEWALTAVEAFAVETGLDLEADGLDTAISDLIADLAHLCDRRGLRLRALWDKAAFHYQDETAPTLCAVSFESNKTEAQLIRKYGRWGTQFDA